MTTVGVVPGQGVLHGEPDDGGGPDGLDTSAWSLDGRSFHLDAPMGTRLPVGSLVELRTGPERCLGQVEQVAATAGGGGPRRISARGRVVARLTPGGAGPLLAQGFDGATARLASDDLVASLRGTLLGDARTLEVGRLQHPVEEPAALVAAGLSRHTFVCGQSGSGKTYTLGVLLEQVLRRTRLRLVVLDPNSDYVGLDQLAGVLGTGDASTDPGDVTVFRAGGEHRLQVRYGRLPPEQQAMVLRIDPLRDLEEYALLRRVTVSMGSPEYSVADLRAALGEGEPDGDDTARRLALRIDNLGVARWGIWAGRDEPPLLDQLPPGWRAAVLDLGGVPTPEERSAVAASVLAALWDGRERREPVLLVVDEAHNVCPDVVSDPQQAIAVEHAARIAAEGRKYGLYLLLATQGPRKLDPRVLGQCDNLLLMRTNSLADVAHLAEVFSHVPRGLVEQAPSFSLGEGLAAGRISPTPQLFRSGDRLSPQGGGDVPTRWADG